LELLLRPLAGDPVALDGRRIHVTPAPVTKGGPRVMIAGGSAAAAKRAGRHGLGFIAYTDTPGLKETFEASRDGSHSKRSSSGGPTGRSTTRTGVARERPV
jgi:alkanesulfonate monooxygenase SsuD/methylene tetrahydromethanopterin reductase-like flavin-dependent oxidoreductase (luciferase family)